MYSQIHFKMKSDNDSSSKQKLPHLPSQIKEEKIREMRGREEEKLCFSLLSGNLWDLGKTHILVTSNLLVL